jgi:hypothetical protein
MTLNYKLAVLYKHRDRSIEKEENEKKNVDDVSSSQSGNTFEPLASH